MCGLVDFLRGKGELGLETDIGTRSCSESTTTRVTCGSGECDGELGIWSTKHCLQNQGMQLYCHLKKIESEMQESGTEWGKKNEVEVESKEGESERIEEEEELDAKGKICS